VKRRVDEVEGDAWIHVGQGSGEPQSQRASLIHPPGRTKGGRSTFAGRGLHENQIVPSGDNFTWELRDPSGGRVVVSSGAPGS
jgi:hypothetical protein